MEIRTGQQRTAALLWGRADWRPQAYSGDQLISTNFSFFSFFRVTTRRAYTYNTIFNSHNMPKRGPENPLGEYSPYKRTKIVTEYDLGTSRKLLAEKYDIPYNSISGIVSRYRRQQSAVSLPRPGRPPVISDRALRQVIREIYRFLFI